MLALALASSGWSIHPVVVATLIFAVAIALIGFLATADRRPITRCFASLGLFALATGAGLQFL